MDTNLNEYLAKLFLEEKSDTIVATGGGTFVHEPARSRMLASGCVVQLTADEETLLKHLSLDAGKRPMFNTAEEPAAVLARLWRQRKDAYNGADYLCPVKEITATTIFDIISTCTHPH